MCLVIKFALEVTGLLPVLLGGCYTRNGNITVFTFAGKDVWVYCIMIVMRGAQSATYISHDTEQVLEYQWVRSKGILKFSEAPAKQIIFNFGGLKQSGRNSIRHYDNG
jgi:hypothetical protein